MEKIEDLKNLTEVSDSMLFMWRAVFAMAHADHVVTPEERAFMNKVLEALPFSNKQKETLENDILTPRWVGEMYSKITLEDDRSRFFYYARLMVWSDGDFDAQEQHIMTELQKRHVKEIDFGNARNVIGLEIDIDETEKKQITKDYYYAEEMKPEGSMRAFFKRFFG